MSEPMFTIPGEFNRCEICGDPLEPGDNVVLALEATDAYDYEDGIALADWSDETPYHNDCLHALVRKQALWGTKTARDRAAYQCQRTVQDIQAMLDKSDDPLEWLGYPTEGAFFDAICAHFDPTSNEPQS